jgi:outer membrane protein assembly factor BamD (BamD/ComL family)
MGARGKLMTQEARSLAHDRKKEPSPSGKPGGHSSTGPAFQHYQSAVQLLQHGKFEKAMAAFEKMLPSAPIELLDRCKMYIITCQRQLENHRLTFLTPEENYDYAISKLNTGYFEEAREQFDGILSAHPNADYAFYGMALLDAITGRTQDCLGNLARAIELNPRNRLQARADNDFQTMVDDPRFTELLYPEVP